MPVLVLSASENDIWKSLIKASHSIRDHASKGSSASATETSETSSPALQPSQAERSTPTPDHPSTSVPSVFRHRLSAAANSTTAPSDSSIPSLLSLGNEALLLGLVSGTNSRSQLSVGAFTRLLAANPFSTDARQFIRIGAESSRSNGSSAGTTPNTSSPGSAVMALVRVPAASNGSWQHYLMVGGTRGIGGGSGGSHLFSRDHEVVVYAIDDLFTTAAACQSDTDLQLLLAHAFSGLVRFNDEEKTPDESE